MYIIHKLLCINYCFVYDTKTVNRQALWWANLQNELRLTCGNLSPHCPPLFLHCQNAKCLTVHAKDLLEMCRTWHWAYSSHQNISYQCSSFLVPSSLHSKISFFVKIFCFYISRQNKNKSSLAMGWYTFWNHYLVVRKNYPTQSNDILCLGHPKEMVASTTSFIEILMCMLCYFSLLWFSLSHPQKVRFL